MTIVYALVSRQKTVLAEHTSTSGEFIRFVPTSGDLVTVGYVGMLVLGWFGIAWCMNESVIPAAGSVVFLNGEMPLFSSCLFIAAVL